MSSEKQRIPPENRPIKEKLEKNVTLLLVFELAGVPFALIEKN